MNETPEELRPTTRDCPYCDGEGCSECDGTGQRHITYLDCGSVRVRVTGSRPLGEQDVHAFAALVQHVAERMEAPP